MIEVLAIAVAAGVPAGAVALFWDRIAGEITRHAL